MAGWRWGWRGVGLKGWTDWEGGSEAARSEGRSQSAGRVGVALSRRHAAQTHKHFSASAGAAFPLPLPSRTVN